MTVSGPLVRRGRSRATTSPLSPRPRQTVAPRPRPSNIGGGGGAEGMTSGCGTTSMTLISRQTHSVPFDGWVPTWVNGVHRGKKKRLSKMYLDHEGCRNMWLWGRFRTGPVITLLIPGTPPTTTRGRGVDGRFPPPPPARDPNKGPVHRVDRQPYHTPLPPPYQRPSSRALEEPIDFISSAAPPHKATPCKPPPYRSVHDPFKTASGVQNSGPWDPWLPVENSRLFANL